MEQVNDQIYFKPGDCVKLRLNMHSPVMMVLRKEASLFKDNLKLKGIRCRWFTANDEIQEAVFNTKDLIKVE